MKTLLTSSRILSVFLFLAIPYSVSLAQVITPSGLNTAVSAPIPLLSGQTQFNITGGTRPGGGLNLFHSFGDFNVPNNNIANFLNNSGLATSNILGRVTGGNISNIFGTIQTTGFGNANLFLMNPAGFLFGPNATINVGGMVTFTSADYLRLADNARFNAIPHTRPDLLLSAAPIAAFGFLGSNPGAITVQGSQLSVAEGTGISLVGGDIQITGGTLKASSGQINLVSIAGRGEAGVTAGGIAITAGTPMGNIVVSGGNQLGNLAQFDASGDEGGAVVIRGGQLSLARTEITTDARTANHTGAGIVVEAMNSATLNNVILNTRTSGFPNPNTVGGAGPVSLTAPSVTASNLTIDTSAFNAGPGGDVAINVGSLTASTLQIFSFVHGDSPGPASGNVSIRATGVVTLQSGAISTSAFGARDAGQIAVQAATLTLTDGATIHSGSQSGGQQSGGRAGNIVIDVGSLTMIGGQISTDTATAGYGGDISVAATGDVLINRGSIDARTSGGLAEGGSITLSTPRLTLDHFGRITTTTFGDAHAGDISVNVRSLNMFNGGGVDSIACCNDFHGSAGNINIVASESISMAGVSDVTLPFPTEISSTTSSAGNAGRVHIVTPTLHLDDQAVMSASSQSAGHAGSIVFDVGRLDILGGARIESRSTGATGQSGGSGSVAISATDRVTVVGPHSAISTDTENNVTGGTVTIRATGVRLSNGGAITATSTGAGDAGTIVIDTARNITTDNGTIIAAGHGQGGNVSLHAGKSVRIHNGSLISADNTGVGNAGHIVIEAGTSLTTQNSTVSAQAGQGNGGTIILQAADKVRLVDSQVNTSVTGGPETVAGNILIESKGVRLKNSQVLSNAVEGDGGNINITTKAFHSDSTSVVEASSQFGTDGTVTIH